MATTSHIRNQFLNYFAGKDHKVVPSSPLVPKNDPTLMFTNAGMVQFKDAFTGQETLSYNRAASSQKCVRAGGKHNDLENVGRTARHHTFFEMLGNFSFGDYFKEDAIKYAWELLTKEFAIPPKKLTVTVYHEDDEAAVLWKKISALPDERIIRIATKDNFWSMGDIGPCGPCSEIFYDHGENIPGGPPGSSGEDGDRFVEVWNLVFMQYEQLENQRIDLPKPSIDTGMGLERIAAVLQGVHDNYDIDLFKSLIEASAEASGTDPFGPHKISHRVIADHLRSTCFLISDGVMPSNEGRGYVLRRIMRRAMRHIHMLGVERPIMWELVPALVKEMSEAYPQLNRSQPLMEEILRLEEERFKKTLGRGLILLNEAVAKLGSFEPLPGEVAFKLYDTYGFPLDLTQDVLKAENRPVDLKGFDKAMEKQREEARASWVGSGSKKSDPLWYELHEAIGITEFLGYECESAEGNVLAIVKDGKEVKTATAGEKVTVITNQTPFYAESGGQVGDTGTITDQAGLFAEVKDTLLKIGIYDHICEIKKGTISVGDTVHMTIDTQRRRNLRANHSATHLLHAALRQRIGEHVVQKGSMVAPDRLRFDFSHTKALTPEETQDLEDMVNAQVRLNNPVTTHLMSSEDAQKEGAMALFGEKYADEVRVVSMGESDFSLELCGGTHVCRTGDIGLFKIIAEYGISSGIRRIEAVTGIGAEQYVRELQKQIQNLGQFLKVSPDHVAERINTLFEDRKNLEHEVKALKQKLATAGGSGKASDAPTETIGKAAFIHKHFEGMSPKDLKPIADELKKQIKSGIIFVTATNEDKVSLVVGVTNDLTDTFDAIELVRAAAEQVGGQSGGGRPDMAQAGGSNAQDIPLATQALKTLIAKLQG
jgi:alanyl-tRNA synthetase